LPASRLLLKSRHLTAHHDFTNYGNAHHEGTKDTKEHEEVRRDYGRSVR
jgi:hypothetical protein